jgi:hypothetical protein
LYKNSKTKHESCETKPQNLFCCAVRNIHQTDQSEFVGVFLTSPFMAIHNFVGVLFKGEDIAVKISGLYTELY